MLKCASLCTGEVDDLDLALSQILTQLSEKIELMANTAGVIMCHAEFVESGALRRVAEGLPFEVAGTTTTAQAVNGATGAMMLSVFVMTSDTVRFRVGMAESVQAEIEGPLRCAVERARDGSEAPSLVLAFPPLLSGRSADEFVEAWGGILPGAPVFGTLSVNDYPDASSGMTICGGEAAGAGYAFILCYGDLNPRFLIATLPEGNRMPHKGEVTRATANVVYEIGGRAARDYLKDVGFAATEGASTGAFWFVPFLVSERNRKDYDGVPVLRGLDSFTEEGAAVFAATVEEGSFLTLLNMDADGAIAETAAKLGAVRDMPDVNGALVFSCVARHMVLVHKKNPLEELERAKDALAGAPFLMSYSGGEICPTSIKDGAHVNRYHDYSLVALVL